MDKKRVLFICRGNIFRSRISESFLRYYPSFIVKSAGIEAKGETISKNTLKAMREINLSIKRKKPEQLKEKMLIWADIVIALDKRVIIYIKEHRWYNKYKKKIKLWDTPDKHKKDIVGIRKVRDMLIKRIKNEFNLS